MTKISRNPTKAAGNPCCIARKQAAQYNDSLNSREGAAEILCIDRTRLAHIEAGVTTARPEEIVLMADGYNAPQLMNWYCTHECPIGKRTVQPLEANSLDRLTVQLLSAFHKGGNVRDVLLEITEDGEIDDDEKPQFDSVLEYLDGISKLAGELRLWKERNI